MHTFKEYADLVKSQHALNKTIAPNETGTTASKAYAVGEKFIRNGILYRVKTAIASGATWSNISSSYEADSNVTTQIGNLTNETRGLIDNDKVNGAVNMLPFDLDKIKSWNTSGSWSGNAYTHNGVTFTIADDGTVTATGKASDESNAFLVYYKSTYNSDFLVGKRVRMTGCPTGGGANTFMLDGFRLGTTSGTGGTYDENGDGVEFTWLNDGSGTAGLIYPVVIKGYQIPVNSPLVFKPMISLASLNLSYNDYVLYAKSNKELMEDVEDVENDLKIVGISSSFFTKASDSFAVRDPHVFKQGRHIFGSFTVSKTSAFGTSQVTLGTLKYAPAANVNSFCALADNRYNAPTALGYLWLNTGSNGVDGPVYIKDADGTHTYAKINLDYVTV